MKPKRIAILIALVVFGIILLQNMQPVEVEMLFWLREMPVLVLMVGTVFLGCIVGWFTHMYYRRSKPKIAKIEAVEVDQLTEDGSKHIDDTIQAASADPESKS